MDNIPPNSLDDHFPHHLREVVEFRKSLDYETDRGCALMVASLLDEKLKELLKANFVDDSKVVDLMLNQSGVLGSFSSRIDAAYLIGLIGLNIRRDLHLIRKVRNEFGHHHLPLSFDNDRISSRCNELFHHPMDSKESSRKVFIRTTLSILATLNMDIIESEHISCGKDLYSDDAYRLAYKTVIKEIKETVDAMTDEEKQKTLDSFLEVLRGEGDV